MCAFCVTYSFPLLDTVHYNATKGKCKYFTFTPCSSLRNAQRPPFISLPTFFELLRSAIRNLCNFIRVLYWSSRCCCYTMCFVLLVLDRSLPSVRPLTTLLLQHSPHAMMSAIDCSHFWAPCTLCRECVCECQAASNSCVHSLHIVTCRWLLNTTRTDRFGYQWLHLSILSEWAQSKMPDIPCKLWISAIRDGLVSFTFILPHSVCRFTRKASAIDLRRRFYRRTSNLSGDSCIRRSSTVESSAVDVSQEPACASQVLLIIVDGIDTFRMRRLSWFIAATLAKLLRVILVNASLFSTSEMWPSKQYSFQNQRMLRNKSRTSRP